MGKGTDKGFLMEGLPVSFGVRTRAKTVALERERKLASALAQTKKIQQRIASSASDHLETRIYLQLRNRTLRMIAPRRDQLKRRPKKSKVPKRSVTGEGPMAAAGNGAVSAAEVTSAPEKVISRTPEISPKFVDQVDLLKAPPIESSLSTQVPSATPGDTSSLRSASVEISSSGGERADQSVKDEVDDLDCMSTESRLSHAAMDFMGASLSDFSDFSGLEQAILCARARAIYSSPGSVSSKDWDADSSPVGSPRELADSKERRAANHAHIMNRRYMHTSLFTDTKAIDGFFSENDAAQAEVGKRFAKKYNYDIVNDTPLKGRFEWVAATPSVTATAAQQQKQQQENPPPAPDVSK